MTSKIWIKKNAHRKESVVHPVGNNLKENKEYSKQHRQRSSSNTISDITFSDDDDSSFDSVDDVLLLTPPLEECDTKHLEVDWEFWSKVILKFHQFTSSESKVLSAQVAQHGVPPALRGTVWPLLTCSVQHDSYLSLLKQESVYEKAILRDLHRTFPHHPFFQSSQGQDSLFNIVKAYSNYDPEMGYCQGLAFVAGPLLLNMPEEEAFGVLVQLLGKYDIRQQFTPQMDLLLLRLYQFDGLLQDRLPHVYRHFNQQGIRSNMYASQWFLTLFAYKFPLEVVYRVYDLLFVEGVNCLFAIGLALLAKNQATLLSLDFDHLVSYLKEDMLTVYQGNALDLLNEARTMTVQKKRLDQLTKAFRVENTKADHEACRIARLKKENKRLNEAYQTRSKACQKMQVEHAQVAQELTMKTQALVRVQDERDALIQKRGELKQVIERMPRTIESRVQTQMHQLCQKNQTLIQHHAKLQDQLADKESLLIEIKLKYAQSETERESLNQRLTELKKWMNSTF
ncbi:rab-GTPase-TBC domain-containing protein [Sporodiniella umbellata]|nr:rab-GTPase-TBC domain-containing protein [Sporodiniella umbellata]